MPEQVIDTASVQPVFILTKNLPDDIEVDILKICSAAERVSGPTSIDGAYCDGGLWRIYAKTYVARALLLGNAIEIDGFRVSCDSVNPFILNGETTERPATRLTLSSLPKSISDDLIIRTLEKNNISVRSKITWEMARWPGRKLSGWKTYRRFLWIELPASPPKRFMHFGPSKAELFYRELREQSIKCYNCQEFGHRASECDKDPVCHVCKQPGHKKGDPICGGGFGSGAGEAGENNYFPVVSYDDNNTNFGQNDGEGDTSEEGKGSGKTSYASVAGSKGSGSRGLGMGGRGKGSYKGYRDSGSAKAAYIAGGEGLRDMNKGGEAEEEEEVMEEEGEMKRKKRSR